MLTPTLVLALELGDPVVSELLVVDVVMLGIRLCDIVVVKEILELAETLEL